MSYETINLFLGRVRAAQRSKGKQVILTSDEAQSLAVTLAQLLAKQTTMLEEINDLKEKGPSQVTEVQVAGGSFKP